MKAPPSVVPPVADIDLCHKSPLQPRLCLTNPMETDITTITQRISFTLAPHLIAFVGMYVAAGKRGRCRVKEE